MEEDESRSALDQRNLAAAPASPFLPVVSFSLQMTRGDENDERPSRRTMDESSG